MSTTKITSDQIDGGSGSGWSLTGNAGTTPGTNFIGTSDTQALVIKTDGVERMRYTDVGRQLFTLPDSTTGTYSIKNASGDEYMAISTSSNAVNFGFNGGVGSSSHAFATISLNAVTLNLGAATGGIVNLQSDSDIIIKNSSSGQTPTLKFREDSANGTNFVGLIAPQTLAQDTTYILPSVDPTAGQVLSATAPVANVSTLSWATAGGGGGGGVMFLPFSGAVSNSFTTYASFLGATRAIYSTETDASIAFSAGTFSKITVYVQLNSQSADVVYTLRKNGAAAGASLTIPAGNTGLFTLTINETILATDLVCLEVVSTSFGLYTATNSFMTFTAS